MDLKTQLETVAKNHQASSKTIENKVRQNVADQSQSSRPSGSLLSNTQPNPRDSKAFQPLQDHNEHVNAVFTRSAIRINLPLVDILAGMSNYGKFHKELISNKHNIEQISAAFLSDESSAMIQNKVPPKLEDPRSFLIPCNFNKTFSYNALADLGASINLMTYSLYAKLSLKTLKPTQMSVRLANRSFQYPIGIAENMLVEVVIRVKQKQLNLGVGTKRMIFNIDYAMKHSYSNDDTCFSIDVIDEILEEDFDALLNEGRKILHSIEGTLLEEEIFSEFDEFMAMTTDENSESESDTEEPLFEKITINTDYKIKTSLEGPLTDLELKPLPDNLEYIQLLDNKKPVVQKQKRLTPNMQEVVKEEIIKLLDTDIIYPITDSPWVSPIHCVPKKGDFSKIARPITKLLEKDTSFEFNGECQKAFEILKEKLTCALVIVSLNRNLPFELMCDASDFAVGVVLAQDLPTNDARVVVTFLKKLFCLFGMPKALISDRVPVLASTSFSAKLQKYLSKEVKLKDEVLCQVQDYALWELIENGNLWISIPQIAQENGTSVTKMSVLVTAEEKTNKKNDVKARSLLLMALPIEHQLTFSQYTDAKTILMNKAKIETISIDDLYNFKIVEQSVKKSVGASSGAQNLAFMTAPSTSSTNDVNTAKPAYEVSTVSPNVNTASPQVSTASFNDNVVYAFMVENPNGSNLLQQNLEQIHEDDLEAIDLKWQLSLLILECFNYHKMGHFARECRAPRNKEGQFRNQDNIKKHGNNEDTYSKAMLAIDGVDSEVYNDKTCSKTCLKNYETLKKQCDDLIVKLNQTEFTAATYKRGLATVEEKLTTYRKNEVLFSEEVAVLKKEVACKDYEINVLKSEFEKVKQEKEGIEFKIDKFDKASKDLDKLLGSQITDKSKKGLGYNVVPLPHPLIYN
ncbi:reverse transcriptase domain-containing protein [Tanacetum coccineum]